MIKRVCDFCGADAIEHDKAKFVVGKNHFRIAVLKVGIQNGVRWKEADTCLECLEKYLQKTPPFSCGHCKHIPVEPTSTYCREGIKWKEVKRFCKFKRELNAPFETRKESIMQAYIGAKIILAEKMTKTAFDFNKGHNFEGVLNDTKPESHSLDIQGYHVIYSNPDGSKYHSWSPKDVFERAYRRVETDEKELISTY